MNAINTQITTLTNTNNSTSTMNHNNTNDTSNEKTEGGNSPTNMNGEKPNIKAQPSFMDIECNGISSPPDLSLDNFLNDDEPSTTTATNTSNTNTNSYIDNKTNIKDLQNIDGINPSTNTSSKSNKNGSTNSDDIDVLNLVRAQLQNSFKYNSPVNEYGMGRLRVI
jgi:hypothetical protein